LLRGKAELHDLVGDPTRARERLGWRPTLGFEELVHLLVDAELSRLGRRELLQVHETNSGPDPPPARGPS
jgi:GDPmannose 4,6-dehydratase